MGTASHAFQVTRGHRGTDTDRSDT